jgi:hypothetical protein
VRIRNPEVALIILELLGETFPEVQRDVFHTLFNTLRFSTKSQHILFSSGMRFSRAHAPSFT